MGRVTASKGFTLIELLIAVALMTVVVSIATMSFSVFSDKWSKHDQRFTETKNAAKNRYLMQQAFQGISNYPIKDNNDAHYYFEGTNKSMRFVTHTPVFARTAMAAVALDIAIDDTTGNETLTYREAPFEGQLLINADQVQYLDYVHQVSLFNEDNIRFNYYGWESHATRMRSAEDRRLSPEWAAQYSARRSGVLPFGINVIWGDNEPFIFPVQHDNGTQLLYTKEKRQGG